MVIFHPSNSKIRNKMTTGISEKNKLLLIEEAVKLIMMIISKKLIKIKIRIQSPLRKLIILRMILSKLI